jgi:hypothetical protein
MLYIKVANPVDPNRYTDDEAIYILTLIRGS